jgi:hypothetical protein
MAGLCADDNTGSAANGNHIQTWTCNGTGAQSWTVEPDGSLRVEGSAWTPKAAAPPTAP